MGAQSNWGVGCCCGGNISRHCDSSAFESSCTDEGQGYPLSIRVGCSLPTDYVPMPDVVATWNGTEWVLGVDSSSTDSGGSSTASSSSEPVSPTSLRVYRRDGGEELFDGSTIVRTVASGDAFQLIFENPAGNPDVVVFAPTFIDDGGGILSGVTNIPSLDPGVTDPLGFDAVIAGGPNGLYTGYIDLAFIGADNSPFRIYFELTLAN